MAASVNPFDNLCRTLSVDGSEYRYYDLTALNDARYDSLPFSIRVLLESAVRCCDQFHVRSTDVHNILDWCHITGDQSMAVEVPFKPARVILQDFTGVPAVVDFAAMRDAVQRLGGDPKKINPICPSDLVIDHSVQVDYTRAASQHLPRIPDSCSANQPGSEAGGTSSWRQSRSPTPLGQPCGARARLGDIEGSVWSPSDPSGRRLQARVRRQPLAASSIYKLASSPSPHAPTASQTLPHSSTASAQLSNMPYLPATSNQVFDQKNASTPIASPSLPASVLSAVSLPATKVYIPPFRRAAAATAVAARSAASDSSRSGSGGVAAMSTPGATLPGCPRAGSGRCACIGLTVPACDVPAAPIKHQICPFHEQQSAFADALKMNQELEFERNRERFQFLKWGSQSFSNMLIVPPGSGIVHQVNLEYLARLVFVSPESTTANTKTTEPSSNPDQTQLPLLYPDSLVGTDSHTTMINGLGVVGWGVGGIEAEAVMLGQTVSMVLPAVVGYRIHGRLNPLATSTDIVLTITKHLRQVGVVGKFVEFFGAGVSHLSIADRATISNMCPEYGATIGFFPVDRRSVEYLRQTGRDERRIALIESYLRAVRMFRDFERVDQDPVFSQVVELDLSTVVPSLSGPKRPHDRVAVADMRTDFMHCLSNPVGFKGYGLSADRLNDSIEIEFDGKSYRLQHGSVVIAAITSCTNTSNPSVMLGAGVLARNAVRRGLTVAPWIKTSLSPGSGVVTHYLQQSGVMPDLRRLGFDVVGYGCMTCIGNSGPLPDPVVQAIEQNDLVCCGVLSGNRNFEGRIHPHVRANYLASPLLVVAYAIAGRVDIDFETTPLGTSDEGDIYLRDIWPSRDEIQALEVQSVIPVMFKDVYSKITKGNESWNELATPSSVLYPWSADSTYIKRPPFFDNMNMELPPPIEIRDAHVLVFLGDSVTTDHISPAGSIARNSPAARYLAQHGLTPRQFNSYGSRRGNDAVMARGTFANVRLVNLLLEAAGHTGGPRTVHVPSGQVMDVFDAADRYRLDGRQTIVLAGKDYGCGSSRDWAAKGPFLLGVRAVLAESYERIHRSNLVGMGLVPLQFSAGESAASLGLSGRETFTVQLPEQLQPGMLVPVTTSDGKQFNVVLRFDTEVELQYHRNGGILNYMVRKMISGQ